MQPQSPTRTPAKTLRLPLIARVDDELAREIEKESVYVSEHLRSLTITPQASEVEITFDEECDIDRLCSKVARYTQAMIQDHQKVEPAIHHRRTRETCRAYEQDVFGSLKERSWLFEHGQGVVSFAGPALKLFALLDEAFAKAYATIFGSTPRQFPAMVDASLLARCGYFEMHPNSLSFVSHLVNDFDAIESFRQANEGRNDGTYIMQAKAFAAPRHCLNPVACFPCYDTLRGQTVPAPGASFTWTGPVFRYESANIAGLDRLWEYHVRELVLMGNDEYVLEARQKVLQLVRDLLQAWDLDGKVETASDPFFATVHAARTFWQRSMDIKYEIKLPLAPGADGRRRELAVGSINLHGTFFCDKFKITQGGGKAAHSGCVGMGIERWMLALFTQHGFEARQWPEGLRLAFDDDHPQ